MLSLKYHYFSHCRQLVLCFVCATDFTAFCRHYRHSAVQQIFRILSHLQMERQPPGHHSQVLLTLWITLIRFRSVRCRKYGANTWHMIINIWMFFIRHVAMRRGPGRASNPRLPCCKACTLTTWPERDPSGQVARAHGRLEYSGRTVKLPHSHLRNVTIIWSSVVFCFTTF